MDTCIVSIYTSVLINWKISFIDEQFTLNVPHCFPVCQLLLWGDADGGHTMCLKWVFNTNLDGMGFID